MTQPTGVSLSTRFWLGMALPTVVLVFSTLLIALVGGQGRGFAGAAALILAFAFVPAALLMNGWALFSTLRPGRLVAAAFILPAYLIVAVALLVTGTGTEQDAGMLLLYPFMGVAYVATVAPLATAAAWVIAMAALVILARRKRAREEKRSAP